MFGHDPFESFFGAPRQPPRRHSGPFVDPRRRQYEEMLRRQQPQYDEEEEEDDYDLQEERNRKILEAKQKKLEQKKRLELQKMQQMEAQKKLLERQRWLEHISKPETQERAARILQTVWRGQNVRKAKVIQALKNLAPIAKKINEAVQQVEPMIQSVVSMTDLADKKKGLKQLMFLDEEFTRGMLSLDQITGKHNSIRERRKKCVELCQRALEKIEPVRKELAREISELEKKLAEEKKEEPVDVKMETPASPSAVTVEEIPSQPQETKEDNSLILAQETQPENPTEASPEVEMTERLPEKVEEASQPAVEEIQEVKPEPATVQNDSFSQRLVELELQQADHKKRIFDLSQNQIHLENTVRQLQSQMQSKDSILQLQQSRIQELEQQLEQLRKLVQKQ